MGQIFSAVDSFLGTDITGSKATDSAIHAQDAATSRAEKFLQPYADRGMAALTGLDNFDVTKDPSYQFRMSEGMKALNAAASARGLSNSGRTLKELTRYGQDYASQEYGNAYNRQLGLANMGYGAAQGLAGLQTNMGNANAAAEIGKANRMSDLTGQLVSGGTTLLSGALFSDARVKENVTPIDTVKLAEMRKHLKAYAFNYKKDFGTGDWVGVLAQDLEKSELGRTLVVEVNGIKTLDRDKVLSMFLATMGE